MVMIFIFDRVTVQTENKHLISNKREWNNCFIKNAPKYRKLDHNKYKKAKKNHAYAHHFCRSWYNGSYTMMAQPMKTLDLHYPMIQFLVI